jgi:hypothetical protein
VKLTNSQKNVAVNVPLGENPKNAVMALLAHAMNRTQSRVSEDVAVSAEMAKAFGIPARKMPSKGRQSYLRTQSPSPTERE